MATEQPRPTDGDWEFHADLAEIGVWQADRSAWRIIARIEPEDCRAEDAANGYLMEAAPELRRIVEAWIADNPVDECAYCDSPEWREQGPGHGPDCAVGAAARRLARIDRAAAAYGAELAEAELDRGAAAAEQATRAMLGDE